MTEFTRRAAAVAMTLSLGLWVGALAGFAFFFAPPTFTAMGPTPQFAALIATVIEQLTDFGYGCAVVAFAAVLAAFGTGARRPLIAIAGLVVLMTAFAWFESAEIIPQMKVTAVGTPAYAGLHKRSSTVYGTVLILGIIALGIAGGRKR